MVIIVDLSTNTNTANIENLLCVRSLFASCCLSFKENIENNKQLDKVAKYNFQQPPLHGEIPVSFIFLTRAKKKISLEPLNKDTIFSILL